LRKTVLVAISCALTLAGCAASFQGHKVPVVRSLQAPPADARKPGISVALHVSAEKTKWPAPDYMQGELDMLHQLQDVFEKSGQFSHVSAGGQSDVNVAIDVLVVRRGSTPLAVLSIATLFIIPTSWTEEYRVTATVTPAGGASRTYALTNTVTTSGGWLMLPVSFFADHAIVTEKVRSNLWKTLIVKMQQDGLLAVPG
jgi:hypothetical protein